MLSDFENEFLRDLFLGARDDEVKELLVVDHTLVVVCHQIYQEGTLLFSYYCLKGVWLQVAGQVHEQRPVVDAKRVGLSVAGLLLYWILLDGSICIEAPGALDVAFDSVSNLQV
jgi:hypothetical protein